MLYGEYKHNNDCHPQSHWIQVKSAPYKPALVLLMLVSVNVFSF